MESGGRARARRLKPTRRNPAGGERRQPARATRTGFVGDGDHPVTDNARGGLPGRTRFGRRRLAAGQADDGGPAKPAAAVLRNAARDRRSSSPSCAPVSGSSARSVGGPSAASSAASKAVTLAACDCTSSPCIATSLRNSSTVGSPEPVSSTACSPPRSTPSHTRGTAEWITPRSQTQTQQETGGTPPAWPGIGGGVARRQPRVDSRENIPCGAPAGWRRGRR